MSRIGVLFNSKYISISQDTFKKIQGRVIEGKELKGGVVNCLVGLEKRCGIREFILEANHEFIENKKALDFQGLSCG